MCVGLWQRCMLHFVLRQAMWPDTCVALFPAVLLLLRAPLPSPQKNHTPKRPHCTHPQERLAQQKAEKAAKGEQYNAEYKPQRTKDEAKERRKAILSNIGEVGRRCLALTMDKHTQ